MLKSNKLPFSKKRNIKLQEYLNEFSLHLPGNFYWKDKNGYYLGCNQGILDTLKFASLNQIIGKTDYDLWPQQADELIKNDKKVMKTGKPIYVEEMVEFRGKKSYYVVIKIPLFDEHHKIVGVIGNSIPINQIKKSQLILRSEKEKVEKENKENKETIQYLQNIVDSVPGSIYWKDRNGVWLGCNEFTVKTTNMNSVNDIIGKTDYQLWPEQADALRENDKRVMESADSIRTEEEVLLPSGEKKYFTVVKMPLRDINHNIVGIIGNSLEITELKKTQNELREAKEKAEASDRAKTEFLENMRHDIRTPLTGIVGFANIIKQEAVNPKIKEYADDLIDSSHALLDLLNEILEVIKISSGEIPLLRKKFDLKAKLENVIKLNQAKAAEKRLSLNLDYDKNIPSYVIGDPGRIQRIVLELVTNALNFTAQGYVKIKVQLAKKEDCSIVLKIKVEDTGIGIPENKKEEIFTRFKRLTPSYQGIYKSGAGLGLTIIKQFVDELNGEIYVDSQPQKGTIFTCVLPLEEALLNEAEGADCEVLDFPIAKRNKLETTNEIKAQNKNLQEAQNRVLLVEDQAIAAKIVQTNLAELNCQVDLAKDGKSACELAKKNRYDLVFMDIGLPDIDGYEVTKRIRLYESTHKRSPVPIVALTAHVDKENKQRCFDVGMDAVFIKPLLKDKAIDILNAFVPNRADNEIAKEQVKKKQEPAIEEPVVDFAKAKEIMGGNEQAVWQILLAAVKSFEEDGQALDIAYQQQDWRSIKSIAHKIKGGALYCGTIRLKEACEKLEACVRDEKVEACEKAYHHMRNEILLVQKFIQDHHKDLKR